MLTDVLPYYIFLAIIIIIYYKANAENANNKFWLIISILVMTLFAGLRAPTVGTDTGSYVRGFLNFTGNFDYTSALDILTHEPGYFLLQLIAHELSSEYWILLCLIAGVCYSLVIVTVGKHSQNKVLSLFIYITLGYYTFCFNAARQAIALSIYITALSCISNGKFIRYVLTVFIAAMFHKSVVIALPLYFLFRMKYSWKSIGLLVIAGVGISRILPSLLVSASSLEDRYILYAYGQATGGYMLTFFYVVLSLFFIFMRRKIPVRSLKSYDIYLQMLMCGSVIYLIVSLSGAYVELTRFAAYFQISSIFLFATVYNTNYKTISLPFLSLICIGCLVFFYIFITSMAGLIPYEFNPNLKIL